MRAPIIECIDFTPEWVPGLARFLGAIDAAGESAFFLPHASDEATLRHLATRHRRDIHCLLVEGGNVLAYGLLRGWDAGYAIPSLGIAVHPQARSSGLGRFLMEYLEMLAARRGSSQVRLRVSRSNEAAIRLYNGRGYRWSDDPDRTDLMVGTKTLRPGPL